MLVLSALGYCGWIVEFFLPTGVPVTQSYVAELSAHGVPYRNVFRALDFGTGTLALASTPFLARLVPAQLMPRLTVIAIALFGIIMLLRGGITLDCAPSASELCARRQDSGAVSAEHRMSWALSAATGATFLLGVLSAERWYPRGMWRIGLRTVLALAVVLGVTIVALDAYGVEHLVGVAVRALLVVQSFTLFAGASYLVFAARVSPDTS